MDNSELLEQAPRLLKVAYTLASLSPDPSSQNGAIIVDDKLGLLTVGWNTFPPGVEWAERRLERPLKYSFIEHAERNAIFAAARIGVRLSGTIMVCPWFACAECARAIACSGISTVIGHRPRIDLTPPSWSESVQIGDKILAEAGLTRLYYDNLLGLSFSILQDGKQWTP